MHPPAHLHALGGLNRKLVELSDALLPLYDLGAQLLATHTVLVI